MRRTGSRIAPRKPSAARISDTIGSPRRSGIKTSPALAAVVRDLVVGGLAVPPDLSPARFS